MLAAVCEVRLPRRLRRDRRRDAAQPRQRAAGGGGRRRGPPHAGHEDPRQRAGDCGESAGTSFEFPANEAYLVLHSTS